jgi:hypothetical protein
MLGLLSSKLIAKYTSRDIIDRYSASLGYIFVLF